MNARPSNSPPTSFKPFSNNSSVVKPSESVRCVSEHDSKTKELHRQLHSMLAAQIVDDSACVMILEADRTPEMNSVECQSPMVETFHIANHITESNIPLSIVPVKSDHSHALM